MINFIYNYIVFLSKKVFYFFSLKKENKKNSIQEKYEWRGLMIDTVRHMPSIDYFYRLVDKMEILNLNKLHLHLSDDQGFRVEIKKYPKINELASFREETVVDRNFPTTWTPQVKYIGDNKKYGGFYSQEELKKLVKYAKEKGVEIVPEIDIPGHIAALLFAYPEFANKTAPEKVVTYWGIFPYVLKNSKESIDFIKNIFDEICEIFDSEYIHIGGDEVVENSYDDPSDSEKIVKEIMIYLNSKKKKVVVWDEMAKTALETGNLIMNWRNIDIGIEQLKKGGEVIFSPNEYFYFDYYQKNPISEPLVIGGYLPIEKVYSFKISNKLREKYQEKILGVQANLWTEYLNTEEKMDYMLFPRLYAFSEVASGKNIDFTEFSKDKNLV